MFRSYSPKVNKGKTHRLRSLLLVTALLIIGGLIGGWLVASDRLFNDNNTAPQKTKDQAAQSDKPEQVLAYKAEDYLFAIPSEWAVIPEGELKELQASGGIKHKNGTALATMTIVPGEQDLMGIENELESKFKALDGFKKISSSTRKVAGHESAEYVFTYLANGKTSKQAVYATPANSKVYYLAFSAREDVYSSFDSGWEHILSTYQITTPEPSE